MIIKSMEANKEDLFVPIHQHPLWEQEIIPYLHKFQQQAIPLPELPMAIHYLHQNYGFIRHQKKLPFGRKPKKIDFKVLQRLYQDELSQLLRDLSIFLLKFRPAPIPLLLSRKMATVQIRKSQMFYLVVLLFMGLVPQQIYDSDMKSRGRFHDQNSFSQVLSYSEFKTRCIVEYLKKTLKEIHQEAVVAEKFLIVRNITVGHTYHIVNNLGHLPLSKLLIQSDKASIEDFNGEIKTDFANRFIGGGCLRGGCVQEEIMFALRPQLYGVTLLCEIMDTNEALFFTGFRRYFDNQGYGDKTKYDGPATVKYDKTLYQNKEVVYDQKIVAINAIKFNKGNYEQFEQKHIDRELLKAYTGFSAIQSEAKIVTGGWGCGVYNGDFMLKVVIQWIAASLARKAIVICPFGRATVLNKSGLVDIFQKMTVRDAYLLLCKAGSMKSEGNLKENICELALKVMKGK